MNRRYPFSLLQRWWVKLLGGAIALIALFGLPVPAPAAPLAHALMGQLPESAGIEQTADAVYTDGDRPSSDGIGKFYLGREISNVMGHRGAIWLERPSRDREEQPQKLVEALDLQPTDVVADLGAGTGYLTFRMAPLVPQGKVLAVDIQPEMLDIIEFLVQEDGVENVEPVLAAVDDPHLPEPVDLVLMVDAYHEFAYPYEVMTAVVESLKPQGRVVLAEYRGENPFIPIKRLHKMTQRQVRKEMNAVGLQWVKTEQVLPRQHLMVFQKPLAAVAE